MAYPMPSLGVERRYEKLPSAVAGADLRPTQSRSRTDAGTRDHARARGHRRVVEKPVAEGQARLDRRLRRGNGGHEFRPRSRLGIRRHRASGENREEETVKRGEVYWADLVPRSGSEQTGRRPVILVSHDGFNETPGWRSIIVVPVSTSVAQARRGTTVIELSGGAGGLAKTSYAVCHQVTTLDRTKLTRR